MTEILAKRKQKLGVNGDTTGIERGDASRRHYSKLFVCTLGKILQEGSFSGPCLASEKNMTGGAVDKPDRRNNCVGLGEISFRNRLQCVSHLGIVNQFDKISEKTDVFFVLNGKVSLIF